MLILALESSAKPASVAVCADGELLGLYFQNCGLTHSRTLLAMAESLLENLGVRAPDVDLVAVSRGPGSFTGVRIGVSAAKGLAWGMDKPVCGVSTLEAMARQSPEDGAVLCPVMDARRGQVYNALFEWRDGALVRVREDRAISLECLEQDLKALLAPPPQSGARDPACPAPYSARRRTPTGGAGGPLAYPSSQACLMGDGAALAYGYLSSAGAPCRMAPDLMRYQTAYGVALAAMGAEPIPAIELEPSYLRPSQAERELENRTNPVGAAIQTAQ